MRYVTSKQICNELQISKTTLMCWRRSGKVSCKELSPKKILYDIDSIIEQPECKVKRIAIYGRVSNTKQKGDLDRQLEMLRSFVVNSGNVITVELSDIASGMNESRSGLTTLLELVHSGQIDEVVITYKDRLTRFGFNYFNDWFKRFGVSITILNSTKEEDFQQELTNDLITIIDYFSMKLYPNRRKIVTECKKQLKMEES